MRDVEDAEGAAAFDAFYTSTSRRVLAHVSAMVGGPADAEDAVAEAYLKAWNRWRQLRDYEDPEGWVRRVAYRHAVSTWRKAVSRLQAHHRDAARAGAVATLGPDHVALVTALRHLPANHRRVVVLHHLVGLGVAEIGEEVGASPGTVSSWLARGRRAMAVHLTEEDEPGKEPRDV